MKLDNLQMNSLKNIGWVIILFIPLPSFAESTLVFSGIKGSVNSDISMRVLEPAYKQLGINVEYLPQPGERSLKSSNSGAVDGEVFRIVNVQKRYKNLIPIPTSINVLQGIAFTRNLDIKIDGWESLRPYNIGIQVGIKFAERGTKGMRRIMVDTNEQLFRMLDSGRVDVIVAAHANGLKTLNALKLKGIRTLRPAIQEYPLYHYLHKRHSALVPKLDAVLQKLKSSGLIKSTRQKSLKNLSNNTDNK